MRRRRAGRGWMSTVMIVVLVVLVALDVLLAWVAPDRSMAEPVVLLLMIGVSLVLHVVVHEGAHALTALLLGMRVPEVGLGDGSTLFRLRIGRTTVKVGNFHGGVTQLEPRTSRLLRTRLALVTVAGPLSNLALAGLVHLLPEPASFAGQTLVFTIVSGGVLLTVLNLLPLKLSAAGGTLTTDGRALLSLLRRDSREGDRILAAGRVAAAHRHHVTGKPLEDDDHGVPLDRTDPAVLGMEGTRRIFTGDLDEAVSLLREAAWTPHEDDVRGLTLNNLAWALLIARPDGWLPEADRASSEAMVLRPGTEAFDSTRGCVLVHLGQLAEGRELLLGVDRTDVPARDLVIVDHHLFLAEHGLAHLYGARAALLALVDDGAPPEMIAWARSLLRPMEVEHAMTTMVGHDGVIRWPEARRGDPLVRHLAEMREALTAFVEDPVGSPRQEDVRFALGLPSP